MASFDRVSAERRRFPALDPEPPPPPWWRRLVIPAAVLVLAAVIVAALQLRPFQPAAQGSGGVAGNSAGLADLAGRIVAVTAAGDLALSDLDGGHVTRSMGNVGQVTAAPDSRSLALLNGQVIAVRHGPALALGHSSVPLNSETSTAWPDPFADHERALVMLQDFGAPSQSMSNPISVVSLATGRAVSLGVGDQVAGDPQAPGAFVSVAASAAPSAVSVPGSADAEIVLRDAGRPPVVLATARTLNGDLGYARGLPASLEPTPSPSGNEVAVAVRREGASVTGIVVLNRAGQILDRVRTPRGTQSAPAWSPSGRSLAYLAGSGGEPPQLRIWTIGGKTVASVLPASVLSSSDLPAAGRSYGACIWSPDGMSILCGAMAGQAWAIAKATGGRVAAVHGPGSPVAWLAARGRR